MPNGHTTYPTLGESIRQQARSLDNGFYPGTVGTLCTLANVGDQLATELAKTRQELEDANSLARARLQVCDSQRTMIETTTEHRNNANSRYLAEVATTDALRAQLTDVSASYNRAAAMLDRLIAYADKQPCMCSEHEVRANVADPCDRCVALGRVLDEPIDA